jgi:hypothetical protein
MKSSLLIKRDPFQEIDASTTNRFLDKPGSHSQLVTVNLRMCGNKQNGGEKSIKYREDYSRIP